MATDEGGRTEQARIAGLPRDGKPSGAAAAPAATVLLVRDGAAGLEVLLARRSSKLAFHGGAWVFPGGRIDPEDYGDAPDDLFGAAQRAAAREAREEAGLDVAAATLVHLSNWTTPEISPKRFATWFFVGESAGGDAVADGTETDQLHWFRPDDAFAARDAGEIELAPPQYVSLLWLGDHATVAEALRSARDGDVMDYTPRFHFVDGDGAVCLYREDVAYEDPGRIDDVGPHHRLYLRDGGWDYVRH
jgi:8-oxo-dGTP pyrophosphatase MutT (NUDIX family)